MITALKYLTKQPVYRVSTCVEDKTESQKQRRHCFTGTWFQKFKAMVWGDFAHEWIGYPREAVQNEQDSQCEEDQTVSLGPNTIRDGLLVSMIACRAHTTRAVVVALTNLTIP